MLFCVFEKKKKNIIVSWWPMDFSAMHVYPFFPAFLNIVTVRINPKFRVCMLMRCFWMHVLPIVPFPSWQSSQSWSWYLVSVKGQEGQFTVLVKGKPWKIGLVFTISLYNGDLWCNLQAQLSFIWSVILYYFLLFFHILPSYLNIWRFRQNFTLQIS